MEELTIQNYKEPLTKIPENKGHGYYGTLISTVDGKKIQCHICGQLFASLPMHINNKHKLTAVKYRETFQLSRRTALVSEAERQRLKMRTLQWLKGLTPEQRQEFKRRQKQRYAAYLRRRGEVKKWNIRLETKNKRGTCPDQILAKIKEVAEKLGHTPSLAEFIHETGGNRYKHLVFKVYGSWKNALKLLGMSPRTTTKLNRKYHRFSTEELLEYLTLYAQENNRIPTATDSKRGLIPNYSTYQNRFGSFEKARELAGVYQFVSRSTLRGTKH